MELVCLKSRVGLIRIKHWGCGPGSWTSQVLPRFCFDDLEVVCFGMDLLNCFRSRTLLLERKLPGCLLAQAKLLNRQLNFQRCILLAPEVGEGLNLQREDERPTMQRDNGQIHIKVEL